MVAVILFMIYCIYFGIEILIHLSRITKSFLLIIKRKEKAHLLKFLLIIIQSILDTIQTKFEQQNQEKYSRIILNL